MSEPRCTECNLWKEAGLVGCSLCGGVFEDSRSLKPTHGGLRKGAGRPKAADPRVNLTVSLPPDCKARIQDAAKAAGVSASEIVARRFAG